MRYTRLILIVVLAMVLAACDSGGDDDTSAAPQAVIDYLNVKLQGDEDGIRGLICAELESAISREAASFASVEAELSEDTTCEVDGTDGDYTMVTCTGNIVALYGTETNEIALTSYRTVQEDGEWRWCGEGVSSTEGGS